MHDQLRALFEDPRFDPPLQPREVAVLAPDIDPYLPYLDAVFGGRGRGDVGFNQAIPYAFADASPLAGAPLAEVFLCLLRSEEHTSELQSPMRSSYAVFC